MAWILVTAEWSGATLRSKLEQAAYCLAMGIVVSILAGILLVTCVQTTCMMGTMVMRMRRMCHRRAVAIMEVPESPPPTKIASTPWAKKSPNTTPQRRTTLQMVRKGGKRRWVMHRRACTRNFDPLLQRHCGFSYVLWCAGTKDIQQERIYQAHVEDAQICGMSVRRIVAQKGHNLSSYLASV